MLYEAPILDHLINLAPVQDHLEWINFFKSTLFDMNHFWLTIRTSVRIGYQY